MKIKSLFIIACAMMFTLSLSAQTRKGTTTKRPTTASKRPAQQTASKPILVDLGLPSGTKWADRNIGATSVTSVGGYYSYGETATKQIYTSDTYTFKSDITNIAGTVLTPNRVAIPLSGSEFSNGAIVPPSKVTGMIFTP